MNNKLGNESPEQILQNKLMAKQRAVDEAKAMRMQADDGHNHLFFKVGAKMFKHFETESEFATELASIGSLYDSKTYNFKNAKSVWKWCERKAK